MEAVLDQRLVRIVPSERQLRHQELEFYAFIHFTVNTFTGREWGDGTESPSIFRPARLDADQWGLLEHIAEELAQMEKEGAEQ